jgi:uridylate kinase
METPAIAYKRVLLKLSGESFCKPKGFGIDGQAIESIAERITRIAKLGLQVAIVVGGGNFFRGESFSQKSRIPRNTADYIGMLSTVINAAALQESLDVPALAESFIRRRCLWHLEQGRVTILAGGTGNPFFTTDTCAALRAAELEVDLMIKATKVDGVYTADPMKDPTATLLTKISYDEVLQKNLKVMDPAAVSLCRDNRIPVIVLNIFKEGNIEKALRGEPIGTWIGP